MISALTLRQYKILLPTIALLFLYLLTTEVWERWGVMVDLFSEVKVKQETIFSPDQLSERTKELTDRKNQLLSVVSGKSMSIDQTPTGIIEFLNANAKTSGVRIESFVPQEVKGSGDLKEMGFTLRLRGGFHQIGQFTNEIEKGLMGIRLKKMDISALANQHSTVTSILEGTAYVLSR